MPGTITPGSDGGSGGSSSPTGIIKMVLRYTVNPLTKTVMVQIIK